MALGKNLKKQRLIPEKETSSASEKNTGKKKSKPESKPEKQAAKKKAVRKKSSVNKAQKEPERIRRPSASEEEKIERHTSNSRYISAAEFERRERLKHKFAEELRSLRGKKVHLIVFKLGAESYAIEIAKTREVVVTPPINRTPHTPEYVKGVTNIRGSVVMAIDLVRKFHLQQEETEKIPQYIMVLNHQRYKVGILIDEVPVTLVADGKSISTSDGVLTDESINETFIKGVIKDKERMIFFVDIDEMLEGDKAHVLPVASKESR